MEDAHRMQDAAAPRYDQDLYRSIGVLDKIFIMLSGWPRHPRCSSSRRWRWSRRAAARSWPSRSRDRPMFMALCRAELLHRTRSRPVTTP